MSTPKERPMLMSGPMVMATLRAVDPKTMTRRVVKPGPGRPIHFIGGKGDENDPFCWGYEADSGEWMVLARNASLRCNEYPIPCPYGHPGGRLWIKEAHYLYGHWRKNGTTKTGRQRHRFVPLPSRGVLFPDAPPEVVCTSRDQIGWHKRNSLFMPRWAARIILEITEVRVERVQDITEADALAEGVEPPQWDTARSLFQMLWESIRGAGAWARNDWCWVIVFKRVEP